MYSHHDCAVVGGPTTSPNKSKMADDSHSEFRKNANISVSDTDIFTQFHKDATQADYGQHLQDGFSLLSRERSDDNF